MPDDTLKKVLISRPRTGSSINGGQAVPTAEGGELELVSTQALKQMLTSRDETDRRALKEAANTAAEGVLARDTSTGYFEIVDDEDLQKILDDNKNLPKVHRPADATVAPLRDYAGNDKFSLVSTQALQKVLGADATASKPAENEVSFNPYDNN